MLYNICYITSNWRLYKQRGFCYVARILLYNKKICFIAHPNLPDGFILNAMKLDSRTRNYLNNYNALNFIALLKASTSEILHPLDTLACRGLHQLYTGYSWRRGIYLLWPDAEAVTPGISLSSSYTLYIGRRFAAALLPRLFGKNPRSHHKGATGRVRPGDQLLPVLCHCQLGQGIPMHQISVV